jgi:hypothetical protein
MADKVFLKCSAKERSFSNGGTKLNISVKVEELVRFAREHANSKGYINLTVSRRREPGTYGDTHSVLLDTWEPRPREASHAPGDEPPF